MKYTKEHEWISVELDIATIGVTDYAQNQLNDVVFVELPDIGMEVIKGEYFAVIESVKAASDIFAPISGEVIEVNEKLSEHPELVNYDPQGEGWIVKIRIFNKDELIDLMKLENISEHGHLKFIIRIIGKLNDLHIYLLKTKIEIKYHEYFTKAYPNIEEFRLKLNNPDGNDIEICFNALYALLLLRLKKTEISAETNNAMTTFSNLLAYLSVKYKQNQN